jgi:hypothetical protein
MGGREGVTILKPALWAASKKTAGAGLLSQVAGGEGQWLAMTQL